MARRPLTTPRSRSSTRLTACRAACAWAWAATAAQGGKVSLQGCGTTSKTVWIADVGLVPGTPDSTVTTIADAKVKTHTARPTSARPSSSSSVTFTQTTTTTTTLGTPATINNYLTDDPTALEHGYAPVINGSDINFSHPFVLTYPGAGFPTDTAAAAAVRQQPDRFLQRCRPDRG